MFANEAKYIQYQQMEFQLLININEKENELSQLHTTQTNNHEECVLHKAHTLE